jgi:hypothetical protein
MSFAEGGGLWPTVEAWVGECVQVGTVVPTAQRLWFVPGGNLTTMISESLGVLDSGVGANSWGFGGDAEGQGLGRQARRDGRTGGG